MMGMEDMPRCASCHRSSGPSLGSRISYVLLAIFATMASVYITGCLWIDSERHIHLIKELDQRIVQGQSSVSVDDTLKVVVCRDQHKKLSELEMELVVARHEGFIRRYSEGSGNETRKKLLAVIGVATRFGWKNNRVRLFPYCPPTVCQNVSHICCCCRWWSSATVAAVTGSNRGIGFEIAQQLAKHGLTIIVSSRDPVQGRAAADGLHEQGLSVDSWKLDVSDAASVGSFAQWVVNKYGWLDIPVPVFLPHFGLSYIPCNFKPDKAGLCCIYGEQFRQ